MFSNVLIAQKGQIVDRFDALGIKGQITLTCVISSGNTCNGIKVFRSKDNIIFEEIGLISGICGSTSSPVLYEFVDEQPLINQTSYYKLEFGSVGFSEVISITLRDLKNDEVRIQPNPAQGKTTIYFSNSSFATHTLSIMDYNGKSLIELSTTNDFFTVDVSQLTTGIYPIAITKERTSDHMTGVLAINR